MIKRNKWYVVMRAGAPPTYFDSDGTAHADPNRAELMSFSIANEVAARFGGVAVSEDTHFDEDKGKSFGK